MVNLSRTGARVADVLADQLPTCRPLSAASSPGSRRVRWWPPCRAACTRARQLNGLLTAEASGRGLLIADLWGHTGPPWRGTCSADLFHPNDLGYPDWTAAFLDPLRGRNLVESAG